MRRLSLTLATLVFVALIVAAPASARFSAPLPLQVPETTSQDAASLEALLLAPLSDVTGAGVLRGHAYGLDGKPLSGATVSWTARTDGRLVRGQAKTNAAGAFSLTGVPAADQTGSLWCVPSTGAFAVGRSAASWPGSGVATFDFAPEGLTLSAVRGGPWPSFKKPLVTLDGADGLSSVQASSVVPVTSRGGSPETMQGSAAALPGVYHTAAVNFWANEGLEIPIDLRVGPGARRVTCPLDYVYDLKSVDRDHGFFAGTGIASTADGAETWTTFKPFDGSFESVDAVDADHAIAVGSRQVSYDVRGAHAVWTADGGATWTATETTLPLWSYLDGVDMVDAAHAWAVGDYGLIVATADGGRTWTTQSSGVTADLRAVAFSDLQHGFAVGEYLTILHTSDGGATWDALSPPDIYAYDWYSAVATTDVEHAWVVGPKKRLRTTDAGTTWSPMTPASIELGSGEFMSVDFVDAQTGWLCGGGGIQKTTDGGETWASQNDDYYGWSFLDMADGESGWVLGDHRILMDTADGGAHWGPGLLTVDQAKAQRLLLSRPICASGPAGAKVQLTLQAFPAGFESRVTGASEYPASARTTTLGTHVSHSGADETVDLRIPSTATPGYAYVIDVAHTSGPLSLQTVYQVCRFKPSATRVRAGSRVKFTGVVPVTGHVGSTKGKPRTVYLFRRAKQASQPTTLDPKRQGWSYLGSCRTNGLGAFTTPSVSVRRDGWYVALYSGGGQYMASYTGVVKVGVR